MWIRIFQSILLTSLAALTALAQDDPMVGDWKLNREKTKMIDVMKVGSVGDNKYSFDFGGGDPENAVADGTDQPGHFGITIAVSVDEYDQWTVIRKKDGKLLVTGVWKLSKDGSTLTDHYTSVRPNGDSTTQVYLYKRTGEGSGFPGTWVSTSQPSNSAVLKVRPWQGDGLSFISQGGGGTSNVKFDGNDYANTGAVVEGLTASARRVDQRSVEMTSKLSGKVRNTQELSVSTDGKVLTITLHIVGRSEPDVQVFERI